MASLILKNEEIEAAFNIEAADGPALTPASLAPQVIPDVYANEFYRRKHSNFIGESDGGHVILSVRHRAIDGFHKVLKTTKKGYEESKMPAASFTPSNMDAVVEYFSKDVQNLYHVPDPDFRQDVLSVEKRHVQSTDHLKIAVLYCKSGQKTPAEFFSNTDAPPAFHTFLNGMGEQIELLNWAGYSGDMSVKKEGKTFYTKFHEIEVIYHVSVMMGAEGHRRLIGNDVCTIFFREEGSEPFDVTAVTNLGTMPQIFIVVQPKGDKYMIASFSRKTIKPYEPAIPQNHLFSLSETREFVLSKLHNGFIQATIFCPPINRLWYTPRGALLDEIATRWPKETSKTQKARLKREKEKYEKLREEAQNEDKKDLVLIVIAGQNLAVRDTLAKSSDPYVLLSLWDQQVKTKVLKQTLNPVWNEEIRLDLRGVDLTDAVLGVEIYDWNLVSSHAFMGEIFVSMEDVIQDYLTKTEPIWLKLKARSSENVSGDLTMRFMLDGFLDETKDPIPDDPEWAKILTGKAPKRGLSEGIMPITGPKIKRALTPPKFRKSTLGVPGNEKSNRNSIVTKSANATPSPSPRNSVASPRTGSLGMGHSASSDSVPADKKRSKSPTLSDRKKNVIDDSGTGRRIALERSNSDDFDASARKRKGSVDRNTGSRKTDLSPSRARPSSPPPASPPPAAPPSPRPFEHKERDPRLQEVTSSGRAIKRTVSGGLESKTRAMSEAPPLSSSSNSREACESLMNSLDDIRQKLNLLSQHLKNILDNSSDADVVQNEGDQFARLATTVIRSSMAINQSTQEVSVEQSLPFLVLKKRTMTQYSALLEQTVIALIRSGKALITTATSTHLGPAMTPFNSLMTETSSAITKFYQAISDLRNHIH